MCASRGIFGVDKYLYLPKYLNTLGIITNPCPSYLFDPHMFSVTLGVLFRKAWLHVKFEVTSFAFMLNALPYQGLGRRTQSMKWVCTRMIWKIENRSTRNYAILLNSGSNKSSRGYVFWSGPLVFHKPCLLRLNSFTATLSFEIIWWPCILLCSPSCMEQYPSQCEDCQDCW